MVKQQQATTNRSLLLRWDEPLYAVPEEIDGEEYVRYFSDDYEEEVAPDAEPDATRAALSVIGAWSDMDWEEVLDALDRIRHESKPTPPMDEQLGDL